MSKLRQLIEILLTNPGLSNRDIAARLGISHNTVQRYRVLTTREGLTLKHVREMTDDELDQLFNKIPRKLLSKRAVDCAYWVEELKKPGMTKFRAYTEYDEIDPATAYSSQHFNYLIERYCRKLHLSMRKHRAPGDIMEIDFAGQGIEWTSPDTGEVRTASAFIATVGVSGLFFVYMVPNQKLPHVIAACTATVEYVGGSARNIVPDNMRTAVDRPAGRDREPIINRTFLDWSRHYKTVVLPAKVRYPKGKAVDEGAVRLFYQRIKAPLRNHTFFSIAEINAAIAPLIEEVNNAPYKDKLGSRRSVFEALDKPQLIPLPEQLFEYSEWDSKVKVDPSYHVRVRGHFYSVPYQLISEYIEPRISVSTVELYHKGKRVAVHARSDVLGEFTVCQDHMPPNHRAYAKLTPEKLISWAQSIGCSTDVVMRELCDNGKSPHRAAVRGSKLQQLERKYGPERLEAACTRALRILSPTVSSIRSILQHRLDEEDTSNATEQYTLPLHENVRGSSYYRSKEV